MSLHFRPDRDDLIFEKEYNVNTKSLEIGLLAIKSKKASVQKADFVQSASEIGKLFKGHNRTWITGFVERFL